MPVHNCTTGETRDETPAELAAIEASRAAFVPAFVSPLQIRRILRNHPKAAQIKTYFQGLTADQKEDWQFAVRVSRTNPLILGLQAYLNVTDTAVDNLFRQAAGEGEE